MRRKKWLALMVWMVAPAGLFGCAGQISVVRQSPSAVELRWMNYEGSIDEATQVARNHCGGQATLASEFLDQDVTLAGFACGPDLSAGLGPAAE